MKIVPRSEVEVVRPSLDEGRFVAVPNDTARDGRLSYRARGLLAAILSHQDGYLTKADAASLAAGQPEGRDAVRRAMRELEQHGYLIREQQRGGDGKWTTKVTVRAVPIHSPVNSPATGKPAPGNQAPVTAGNAADRTGDWETGAGEPGAGKPAPESQALTEKTKKKTTPLPPVADAANTTADGGGGGTTSEDDNLMGIVRSHELDVTDDEAAEVIRRCKADPATGTPTGRLGARPYVVEVLDVIRAERRRRAEEERRHAPRCEEHTTEEAAACRSCLGDVGAGHRHPDDVGRIARRAS